MAPASSPSCRRCCRRSRAVCRSCAPATNEMPRRALRRRAGTYAYGLGTSATARGRILRGRLRKNTQKKKFRDQSTLVVTRHRHAGIFSLKLMNLKRPTQKLASRGGMNEVHATRLYGGGGVRVE